MKISAERLKKIIKEEVRHVREMPETPNEVDTADAINRAAKIVEDIAEEMYGLVNPDAPPESPHYQVGDTLAKELVQAVAILNQAHAALIPGAAEE